MLDDAESLLRERGFAGSGIQQIAARGDAPIGSLYHHFPGGKTQLVEEALQLHADKTRELLASVLSGSEPIQARVRELFSRAAKGFERGGAVKSCAIGNVTLDVGAEDASLREVCRGAFDSWVTTVARLLPGEDQRIRESFAEMVVIALEGAFVRARAEGSGRAFITAGEWLAAAAESIGRTGGSKSDDDIAQLEDLS